MEPRKEGGSIFHTDQGRWDRRDFIDRLDDGDERILNVQEDDFHEPAGHIYSDDELERVVKKLLRSSQSLDASDITVTADKGNLTLSGTVKSDQQKHAASSMLGLLHGVGVVQNDLIVKINEGILPTDVGRDEDGGNG